MTDTRARSIGEEELEERLRTAFHHLADASQVRTPTVDELRDASRRRDRQVRTRIGTAVLAAAAILVALVVVRWSGTEEAYVDLGPGTRKPPLHLVLDEAAGFEAQMVTELRPDPSGRPPGTSPGPFGRNDLESAFYAGDDLLSPPWLSLHVLTSDLPTGPWGEPAGNQRATTVGGRPAVLTSTTIGSEDWTSVSMKWDERRSATANFWGLTPEQVTTALASLHQGPAGRWTLAEPPPGLREVASIDEDEPIEGWYQTESRYLTEADSDPDGMWTSVQISAVEAPVDEPALVARLVPVNWGTEWRIERTTVRGHPALVVVPTGSDPTPAGGPTHFRFSWYEPEHDVEVTVLVGTTDRAVADQAVAALVELSPDEWQTKVDSCTGLDQSGTTYPPQSWESGGPCPAYQARGG